MTDHDAGRDGSTDARGDREPLDITAIEAMIAASGDYVFPSDDLRPRVLEAARERFCLRRTWWHLAGAMVAATLCVCCGVSLSNRLQARAESAAMPRGQELDRRIVDRGAESGESRDWALAEIVGDWRDELAGRVGDGEANSRPTATNRRTE